MKQAKLSMLIGALAILALLAGCGAGNKMVTGTPETGLNLMYVLNPGETLQYRNAVQANTSMEMMGQTMDIKSQNLSRYTLTGQTMDRATGITAQIVVDSLTMSVESMQGNQSPDLTPLTGKPFVLQLTPQGEETFSGADSLKISLGQAGGGEQDVTTLLRNMFPDLPKQAIKIGDTWTTSDTLVTPQMGAEVTVISNGTHKFEGIEVVDGEPCVKIVSTIEGTLDGAGEQMGAAVTIEGDLSGESTVRFAYQKGQLVDMIYKSVMEGSAAVSGAANMTIPMSVESVSRVTRVK